MKICIAYKEDNHKEIFKIVSFDFWHDKGKTDDEIQKMLEDRNAEDGWTRYKIIDVPKAMTEIMEFMLGEKKYKKYKGITQVYDMLYEIKDDIESIQADCYETMNVLEPELKKLEELIPE